MTYNSPFPPPPPQGPAGFNYYRPGNDLLAPARRAGIMLWILGGLFVIGGLCISSLVWVAPLDQVVEQARTKLSAEQLKEVGNLDLVQIVKVLYTVGGVLSLLVGVVLVSTATFVRRGRRGAAITAMVVCILLALWCVISILGGLIQAASGWPLGIAVAAFWIAVGGAVGVTILWLGQTLRVAGAIARQRPWPPPNWLYQQQQMAPPPSGYGYGQPPGTPPPAASPQQSIGPLPPPTDLPPPPDSREHRDNV